MDEWKIDKERFDEWVGDRLHTLGSAVDLKRPSRKSLAFLALIERDKPSTYEEITATIAEKKVVRRNKKGSSDDVPMLRVAISEIGRSLRDTNHFLQLKTTKEGRVARFELVNRKTSSFSTSGNLNTSSSLITQPFVSHPDEMAQALLRDGGLPFSAMYTTYRAAAWWLSFSTDQASGSRQYEGHAFEGYELGKRLGIEETGRLGVVSLAPGEGVGEVDMLTELLAKYPDLKIDYLAVDCSDILLMSHGKLLGELFREPMEAGRLNFVPVVGDLYQLGKVIALAQERVGPTFLSKIPIVCCCFGNCIGNYEFHEWELYKSILDAFDKTVPLATLVGASLLRRDKKGNPIAEKYTMDSFLLETPRHLMHDLGLLISEDEKGSPLGAEQDPEFVSPPADKSPEYIPATDYSTPQGISGQVYRFYYTLKHRISTKDKELKLNAGERLLLYSIVKYDLLSFVKFLKGRGLEVLSPPEHYRTHSRSTGEEKFSIVVVATIR